MKFIFYQIEILPANLNSKFIGKVSKSISKGIFLIGIVILKFNFNRKKDLFFEF
jgi:hypothetical protein